MQNDTIWCPICGKIHSSAFYVNGQNGKDAFGIHAIPKAYFVYIADSEITYPEKFFVCQNGACNWPVMSPLRFLTLFNAIKTDYLKDLEGKGSMLFSPRQRAAIKRKLALDLARNFTCPKCSRPIFFYKPYALFSEYEKKDYDKKHTSLDSDYKFHDAIRSLP